MSGVARPADTPAAPIRRVRHDVRDGLAVMAFSAATSVGLATLFTILTGLGK